MSRPFARFLMAALLLVGGAAAGFAAGWMRPGWAPAWARDRLARWAGGSADEARVDSAARERSAPEPIATIEPDPSLAREESGRKPLPTVRLASEEIARLVGIETAPAGEIRHVHLLSANAETAYDARRYATVSPRVAGFLREVRGDLGRRVQPGEVLAVVDSAEISAARSQLLAARAAAELAQATLDRTAALAKTGQMAARTELESRAARDQARAARMDAEQRLRNLGLDDAGIARIRPSDERASLLEIVAPIEGTVVAMHAVRGEAVQPTAPLFTIADTRTMWLWTDVYEADVGRVSEGQAVEFLAAGAEGSAATGSVTWMGTEVDPMTRTTRVRAELANPDGRLRANQFGKARLRLGEVHRAAVVPSPAVQRWAGGEFVFLPRPGNAYEPREVHARPIEGEGVDRVEIVDGLKPGERVVVAGAYRLKAEIERDAIAEE